MNKSCVNCNHFIACRKESENISFCCVNKQDLLCGFNGEYPAWQPVEQSGSTPSSSSPLSRTGLSEFMTKSAEDMKQLFQYKNTDYGADADAFANFRKTAQRVVIPWVRRLCGLEVSEREAMFLVLMTLADKHLVALSQTGIDGHEVAERLQDVAVYAMIGKAMKENG